MISPDNIPTFTGDLIELRREITSLRRSAKAIREHGRDVHTRFQHLDASYKAPEAEQLFATTQAVQGTSGSVADKLETVAGALEEYAVEVADIVKQLEALRGQAAAFVASVKGDDNPFFTSWRKDQGKVDEHQALWDGVNAAVAAFQRAEVACADKITALVGGTQWHINDGSPKQKNSYGFSAEQLAQAPSLPWGSPEHYEALPGGIDYHLQQTGLSIFDNAKGAVEGLVDLFSPGEQGDATREGLARVVIGAEGYLMDPYGDNGSLQPIHKQLMDENKTYAKEFAKSFVGWDDWSTNPGKAMGTVIFNGLTLGAGPLGAASRVGSAAGEVSAAARVAGTLSKVGEVLDPIGAASKAVGVAARALPRVADLTAGVRAATDAAAASDATHSFLQLSDGSHLRISDGEFIPGTDGVPDTTPARHEPAAADRVSSIETPHHHELVGAGARAPEVAARGGEHLPPQASHESGTPHRSTGDAEAPSGHEDARGHHEVSSHDTGGGHHSSSTSADATSDGGGAGHHSSVGQGGGSPHGRQPAPIKEWKADDNIVGPARGKTLLYPNSRHDLSGVKSQCHVA
ncbi:hypothetical protein [Streptomyces sp. CA-106131]|uniref:hypothetical protein n=1 Tax=Streptomyces sp. CA-106131 TaxID=3240045 RepID=UPI003D8E5AFA